MAQVSNLYQDQARAALNILATVGGFAVWAVVAAIIIFLIFRLAMFYLGALSGAGIGLTEARPATLVAPRAASPARGGLWRAWDGFWTRLVAEGPGAFLLGRGGAAGLAREKVGQKEITERVSDRTSHAAQSSGGPSCSPAILTMRGSKRATFSTRSAWLAMTSSMSL